jgi:hypothetical protein
MLLQGRLLPETVVARCRWWEKSIACELIFQACHGGGLSQLKGNPWPLLEVVAESGDKVNG